LCLVAVGLLSANGCSKTEVIVRDSTGAPVQGATVSESLYGHHTFTDAEGRAALPSRADESKLITIRKDGHRSVEYRDVTDELRRDKPVIVTLTKSEE
jgi:hypothetical protein